MLRTTTPHVLNHYSDDANTGKKNLFTANFFPIVMMLVGAIGLLLMIAGDASAL